MSDCVIALDHRTRDEISTRRLQVVKYLASAHWTSPYPFLITERGFEVPPVTSVALDFGASSERISSGVPGLDSTLSHCRRPPGPAAAGAAGTAPRQIKASQHIRQGAGKVISEGTRQDKDTPMVGG